jgi:glycosyltransferase involved in cell wall biosynthesis
VLSDEVAVLTDVSPGGLADGILGLLRDRERSQRLGEAARRLAEVKYSYEAYLERTRQAYAHLAGPAGAPADRGDTR